MYGEKVIGSMEKERNGLNNITNYNFVLWDQRLFYINKKIKSEYNMNFEKFAEEYFKYHSVDIEIKSAKEKIYKEID